MIPCSELKYTAAARLPSPAAACRTSSRPWTARRTRRRARASSPRSVVPVLLGPGKTPDRGARPANPRLPACCSTSLSTIRASWAPSASSSLASLPNAQLVSRSGSRLGSGPPARGSTPVVPWTRAALRSWRNWARVWSHCDVAWQEGSASARGWAAEHGHLLAPMNATCQGYRVGIFLKNARAAARKAAEIEQRRAEGLPVQSSAGRRPKNGANS
ncbi:helicase associated domain-containing protein [Streptomyces sp. NPDC029554]|uniref:helicase associated domain-containing protein n=1 Tax=Streptomyces sp. NPDC029554 TaxID=3155126 RepID=UPI00340DB87D